MPRSPSPAGRSTDPWGWPEERQRQHEEEFQWALRSIQATSSEEEEEVMPFYGVRASRELVGDGHGVFQSWEEVRAYAILHKDPRVRAAMHGNYKRFDTQDEAQEYADSEPIVYPQFLEKKWRDYLRFVALLLGLIFLSFLTLFFCDQHCGFLKKAMRTDNFCNACTEIDKILKDYTLQLYSAGGVALLTALGGMVNLAFQQL